MNKKEGRMEITYQITMAAAWRMLEQGLISREDYVQFDTIMRQKYAPVFGIIYSNIDLRSCG